MKKLILPILIVLTFNSFAQITQVPQGFNYQAIVRDYNGSPITGKIISIQISILQHKSSGVAVYIENHDSLTSNKIGLVNFVIGQGHQASNSPGSFAGIPWVTDSFFVSVALT